jgi:phenylacetate-CoA ligase
MVEARPDAGAEAERAACSRDLAARIKALIGVTVDVNTVEPNKVERSIGKAKRVIDLRGKS